jgi:hypothetical protein
VVVVVVAAAEDGGGGGRGDGGGNERDQVRILTDCIFWSTCETELKL